MNCLIFFFSAISAAICGWTGWVDLEEFGKGKIDWLKKIFLSITPFSLMIPQEGFVKLDPDEFSKYLSSIIKI